MKSTFLIPLGAAATILLASATTLPARSLGHFNQRGNILIVDQLNNRVIEVNTNSHAIVWQFGDSGSVAGAKTILAPHDAERFGSLTYIACTGVPPGGEPSCPAGCPDSRVIAVTKRGRIVWQYGHTGITGSGDNELNNPVSIRVLPRRRFLITDQGNQRVIEITRKKKIVWQYGTTGISGSASNQLNNPACAERRHNGHTLIADQGNNRVIEVTRRNTVDSQIDIIGDGTTLNGPADVSRLSSPGRTLIADSFNNRILEVDANNSNVFEFVTSARPNSVANPNPTHAVLVRKDRIVISDQFNHQVIEINAEGTVIFEFGTIGVAGSGTNELNGPCDAKVIGDYTGLTTPRNSGGGGSGFSFGGGF